jgi:hypothetical protein
MPNRESQFDHVNSVSSASAVSLRRTRSWRLRNGTPLSRIDGAHTGKTISRSSGISTRSRSASFAGRFTTATLTPSRHRSGSRPSIAAIRTSISGWSEANLPRRGTSHHVAKAAGAAIVSTPTRRWLRTRSQVANEDDTIKRHKAPDDAVGFVDRDLAAHLSRGLSSRRRPYTTGQGRLSPVGQIFDFVGELGRRAGFPHM